MLRPPLNLLYAKSMNKSFLKVLFTFLAASATIGSAHADVLLTEDFNYPAGALYNQGGWMRFGTKTEAPLQLSDKALSYEGYAQASGKAVTIAGNNNGYDESLYRTLAGVDGNVGYSDGAVYFSLLLKAEEVSKNLYFYSLLGGVATAPADGKSGGSDIVRVFVAPGDNVGMFKIGMSKNAAAPAFKTQDIELNKTYLIVGKYEFVDGATNDIFSMWVNPTTAEESVPDMVQSDKADVNQTRGFVAVELRQASSSVNVAPKLLVDQLRVATTWAELFGGEGGGEEPEQPEQPGDAAITVSAPGIDFEYTIQGAPVEKTLTVSGTGLTGDITASVSSSDFKLSTNTIAKADAEAGATITVTYTAAKAGAATGTVTFKTAGAEDVVVSLKGEAQKVTTLAMSTAIINQTADDGELYRYTQKATVTYVDAAKSRVYAQDIVGGLCIDFSYMDGVPLAVGDVFNSVLCYITKEQGVPYLLAIDNVAKTGSGTKSPTEVSAASLLQDPESYIHRLVTLTDDVLFEGVNEGDTFKASAVRGTSGEKAVTVLPFAGSDIIGTAIPQRAAVTGISRSLSIASLSPRGAADVVSKDETAEEAFEVTYENILADKPGEVGVAKDFARCIVNATALTAPVEVYLTGANRAMFDIDVTEIPAGTGTTVVTISYKPTAIGKHTGRINFESAANPLLNTGNNFTAIAIDHATPPVVSVDAEGLTAFAAALGQTQEQAIVVTTANLPDYGTARIVEPSGAFRISSTSLLRDGANRITITFAPRTEGTFTDVIEFTAPYGNTERITVSGTSGGDIPVVSEGDTPFVLDTTDPRTYLVEDFETETANNKPLHIDGWKNFALEGTRAWWSYATDEGTNKAAKVTAYDLTVAPDKGTPCLMTLVSPALDFKNTEHRLLTFRIMGQYMYDGMSDALNVLYVTYDGTQMYGEVLVSAPAASDYNDEWQEYVVDLEGLDLEDVFFVGFNFDSTRGRDNSTVYYVDDVTWGRDDVLFIRPSQTLHEYTVKTGVPVTNTYSVTGLNLTAPIKLHMVGSHAANFTLSTEELPAEGGSFDVTFNTDADGLHTGFVEMKSEGAPVSYIDIYATADADYSGVGSVAAASGLKLELAGRILTARGADAVRTIEVYTADGALVAKVEGAPVLDLGALPAGLYVARATTATTAASVKIALK